MGSRSVIVNLFTLLLCLCSLANCSVPGEVRQDKSVLQDGVMPLLAPPLTKEQIKRFHTLQVYCANSDFVDAAGYHWSSPTVQQQINENISMGQKKAVRPFFVHPPSTFTHKQDSFYVHLISYVCRC